MLGFVRVSLIRLGRFSSGDPVGEEGSTGVDCQGFKQEVSRRVGVISDILLCRSGRN